MKINKKKPLNTIFLTYKTFKVINEPIPYIYIRFINFKIQKKLFNNQINKLKNFKLNQNQIVFNKQVKSQQTKLNVVNTNSLLAQPVDFRQNFDAFFNVVLEHFPEVAGGAAAAVDHAGYPVAFQKHLPCQYLHFCFFIGIKLTSSHVG